MIELRKAGGEFARARTGCGNDNKRTGGFDVRIGAVTFVGNNGGYVGGIAFGEGMEVSFDFVILELAGEIFGFFLAVKQCDDYRTDVKTAGAEKFDETKYFGFVGNHVVGTDFGMFYGIGVDTEDDFGFVFEFLEELDFEVGQKAG